MYIYIYISRADGALIYILFQKYKKGGHIVKPINTLRPRQDGRHFPDDILKCILFNENVWISLTISLKCVQKVRINIIPSLVQIMAWRRPGDKPLSEPMMVSLLTHICVTRPQWVKEDQIFGEHDHLRYNQWWMRYCLSTKKLCLKKRLHSTGQHTPLYVSPGQVKLLVE